MLMLNKDFMMIKNVENSIQFNSVQFSSVEFNLDELNS